MAACVLLTAADGNVDQRMRSFAAQHVKALPGCKTDVKNRPWLVAPLRHGLFQPSFIPPSPARALRDSTRSRKTLIQERRRRSTGRTRCWKRRTSRWPRWRATSSARVGDGCWRPSWPASRPRPSSPTWPIRPPRRRSLAASPRPPPPRTRLRGHPHAGRHARIDHNGRRNPWMSDLPDHDAHRLPRSSPPAKPVPGRDAFRTPPSGTRSTAARSDARERLTRGTLMRIMRTRPGMPIGRCPPSCGA
jgi:hypothetical protein